ncbi:hypothetical protein [Trichloromonas sp.]|uniref:hypothetical protein n=1 Tax=Trichloromonas sp. TaxID=3069249 RepID=UPI003D81A193
MKEQRNGIRVGAIHGPGSRITPVWFDLNRKKHTIRQITNIWQDKQGAAARIHFYVTDDGALYELVYDLADTTWQLEQIDAL